MGSNPKGGDYPLMILAISKLLPKKQFEKLLKLLPTLRQKRFRKKDQIFSRITTKEKTQAYL